MAAYNRGKHTKRFSSGENPNPIYDEDGDELPPWFRNSTTSFGEGEEKGKRQVAGATGPTCYYHKNKRPLVEDTFTVVSGIAYHPEMYWIGKDQGRNVQRTSNTASLNVRSVTGQKYGVKGTDIARAGGLIMDYW